MRYSKDLNKEPGRSMYSTASATVFDKQAEVGLIAPAHIRSLAFEIGEILDYAHKSVWLDKTTTHAEMFQPGHTSMNPKRQELTAAMRADLGEPY
jgi:hypothetical protein